MKKITQNDALLNLVKHLATEKRENQSLLKPLFKKLSQSRTLIEKEKWSNKEFTIFSEEIKAKPILESFSKIPLEENPADYLVTPKSNSGIVERLKELGSGKLKFNEPERLGPFLTDQGEESWFQFHKLQSAISVTTTGNPTPLIFANISKPIEIYKPKDFRDFRKHRTEPIDPKRLEELGGLQYVMMEGVETSIASAYTLSKGTIWISVALFDLGAPLDKYLGFRIEKGVLAFPIATKVSNADIRISGPVKFALSLTLDSFKKASPIPETYGIDAYNTELQFPKTLTLQFTSKNILNIATADEIAHKIYGKSYQFNIQRGRVNHDALTDNYYLDLTQKEATAFEILDCQSADFEIIGKVDILNASWFLEQSNIQNKQPTALETNGSIGMLLGNGLSFFWKGLANKAQWIALKNPLLTVGDGEFQLMDKEANFQQQSESYQLWHNQENHYNTLELSFAQKKSFTYACYATEGEGVGVMADVDFQLDRPFQADGIPISPTLKNCNYVKFASDNKMAIMLLGPPKIIKDEEQEKPEILHQFAINNAFFSTTEIKNINFNATYDENNQLNSGLLKMNFGLVHLEPILPHPYAFNNAFQKFYNAERNLLSRKILTSIQCVCKWNIEEADLVDIDFVLPKDTRAIMDSWFQHDQGSETIYEQLEEIEPKEKKGEKNRKKEEVLVQISYPNIKSMCALVDLSTSYDYLGISMYNLNNGGANDELTANVVYTSENEVSISRMFLEAPMRKLAGVTLPQVSWEPYVNLTSSDKTGNLGDPEIGVYNFDSQAEPTIFCQSTELSVPIDPLIYMQQFKENLRPSSSEETPQMSHVRGTEVYMSLPNGKLAMAQLSPYDPKQLTLNQRQYDLILPHFEDAAIAGENKAQGGWQFRIAANDQGPFKRPFQNGWAFQLSNVHNVNTHNKKESPLGVTPHGFFQNVFYNNEGGVPITHLDLSGYGASTYSNWLNPEAKYATVAQVKFDVLRGRVAHEIVQVASMIYPWGIAVTRTISFYKRNNAVIYREDSGWVATSEGLFDYTYNDGERLMPGPYEIHPGHIQGLFNIRNIKEIAGETDKFNNSPEESRFIAVSFDTDVAIEHISSATIISKVPASSVITMDKVPGWGFKGYLQLAPESRPVDNNDLIELFLRKQNNIGGNVDAIMQLAGGSQQLKVKRVDMSVSANGNYVVAVRGSVLLPADGSWSVVEFNKQTQEVKPIADKQSSPVYKIGRRDPNVSEFSVPSSEDFSRITSPNALFIKDASPQYGYLQNTGTQKLLFPNPFYDKKEKQKLFSDPTKLADSFTLMNSKGIFPNIDKAINAEDDGVSTTDIVEKGLKKIINKTLKDRGDFNIIGEAGDDFRIYAKYETGEEKTLLEYATNSESVDEAWKNHMSNMSVVVDMGPFKPIMTISGDFSAKSGTQAEIATSAKAPQLKLPPTLEKIYQILQFLDSLDFTKLGNNAAAVKKGLQVFMSNGADAWDYKFKAEKEIPFVRFPFDAINYNSPTTPLKMDASFKMGCYFNIPIKVPNAIEQLTPSVGAFLELTADIRVMCVSLAAATIYAKGTTTVGLAADLNNPPTLYFKFGFGVELCVGLPVIGSVSVTYMVAVDMSINENEFIVGAFIYFRGRIELAFGMVEVAISIEAAGKIERPEGEPCVCVAAVTFALDICVAFVIDLDFRETWTEKRQIAAKL